MARSSKTSEKKSAKSTATIGFEAKLWQTADKTRNNMDAAEYKHVVLDSLRRGHTAPVAPVLE